MSKTCAHLGVDHPMYFQCGNCDDTADTCNCNICGMVFCAKCQELLFIDCDDVLDAWIGVHPDLDMSLERLKIEGLIKDYKTGSVAGLPNNGDNQE